MATAKLAEAVCKGTHFEVAGVTPNEAGSNDSIWIEGAPPRASGGREYVLTQMEHAATNEAQRSPADTGYVNPSSFQIISAGTDEAGSRLFVGNLTMHSDVSNEPEGEVLVFSEEGAVGLPAVQSGAWIADVTYGESSSSSDVGDPLVLVSDVDSNGAIAGIVIAATTDNNRLHPDDGAALYDAIVRLLSTSDALVPSDFFVV